MPTISSGVTSGATFSSGTTWSVVSGAEVESSLVQNGASVYGSGALFVSNTLSGYLRLVGSSVSSDTVVASGGDEFVIDKGAVSLGDIVLSGGTEVAVGSAIVSSAYVSGGYLVISSYGSSSDTTLVAGGSDRISSGGYALDTIVSSGGTENVAIQGASYYATVLSGGLVEVRGSGGGLSVLAIGDVADGGGISLKGVDAESYLSVLESGGYEFAQAGAESVRATVSNGGIDYAGSGGLVAGADVLSGGAVKVEAGGSAFIVTVAGGGLVVSSGGVASSSTIEAGIEIVLAGGTESAATVGVSGKLLVSSGGTVAAGLTLAGGTAVLSGVMSAGETVYFASAGADLVLADVADFGATISGFRNANQRIDLDGFAYNSTTESAIWTQSGTSGTLTVTDGGQVANLTLIGSYSSGNFHLSDDGHGGTYVIDPPVAPKPAMFAQTMAAFGAGAGGAGVGSIDGFTGSALLDAPPLVPAATGSAVR